MRQVGAYRIMQVALIAASSVNSMRGTDGQWYTSALPATPLVSGVQYYLALGPSGASSGTYVGSETDGTLSVLVDYTP
jgi:hypothetical protein